MSDDTRQRSVGRRRRLPIACSRALVSLVLLTPGFSGAAEPAAETHHTLEQLLRAQAFNKAFEGFDSYVVTIESDHLHADGSREVIAVASGRFLGQEKRLRVEFLVVGERVIGGQILEHANLPPCTSTSSQASSL